MTSCFLGLKKLCIISLGSAFLLLLDFDVLHIITLFKLDLTFYKRFS